MWTFLTRFPLHLSMMGAPKTTPVVAYLRSRPSAGAASNEATSAQRELLAKMTSENEIAVVAEFSEVEDESEDRPAYRAACHEAALRGCVLLTAGWGGIGTGPWFQQPDVSDPRGVEVMAIPLSYVRFAELILVPQETPALVALWADYRPSQGVTAIYLCNAGPDAMEAIRLMSIWYNLGVDYGMGAEREILKPIPAGMARLLTTLFHNEPTYYSRYHLSYALGGLLQEPLKASDGCLNGVWSAQDPSDAWVAFRPATPDEAAAAEAVAARLSATEREQSP